MAPSDPFFLLDTRHKVPSFKLIKPVTASTTHAARTAYRQRINKQTENTKKKHSLIIDATICRQGQHQGDTVKPNAAGESCLLHVRCLSKSNVIRLHLRRRPLSSRPGSKDAVPSEGRAAHREHEEQTHRFAEEQIQARTPQPAPYPQTSPLVPTSRQDAGYRTWAHTEDTAQRKQWPPRKGRAQPGLCLSTKSPGCCRRRGEPIPLSPRLEGADPRKSRPPAQVSSKGGSFDRTGRHLATGSRRHKQTANTTHRHHLPAAQGDASKEGTTPERRRRPFSKELGFSPRRRGGERARIIPHRRLQGGERRRDVADDATTKLAEDFSRQGP